MKIHIQILINNNVSRSIISKCLFASGDLHISRWVPFPILVMKRTFALRKSILFRNVYFCNVTDIQLSGSIEKKRSVRGNFSIVQSNIFLAHELWDNYSIGSEYFQNINSDNNSHYIQ